MERITVFILIFLCFLVSNTVCKEEPNHLSTESFSEVSTAGFTNPSTRDADEPLRSKQHNFAVHTSPNTDSFTFDDERIGLLDGQILPASKDGLKPTTLAKNAMNDKMGNVPTLRKRGLSRLRKLLKGQVSSHGARMPTVPVLADLKGEEAFAHKNSPPSIGTGEPYKMKINTPLKLTILPTEETVTPSVDMTDAESDWIFTQDYLAEQDEAEKSSHKTDHKDDSLPNGEPKMTGHEESTRNGGTSAIPQHKMAVHPGMKTPSGLDLRWNVAREYAKLDESKKGKRFKKKQEKSDSRTEDPADSDSSAAIVAGILARILMFLFFLTGVPCLWEICKKRWRRRYERELRLNIPSTGYTSEELSEDEVLFDRSIMGRNKNSHKGTSPKSTPYTSPRRPKSALVSTQSGDQESQEQKVWTPTDTPKSTPLMSVPTLTDTTSPEGCTVIEIPESKSLDSSSKESSSLSLLPAASDELTCTVPMATDSTSSFTESCKTSVASRSEVVIIMDDDDDEEIIYTSEKSQCKEPSTVRDVDKDTNREEVVLTMEHDDGEDGSLMLSECEASSGELINRSEKLKMNKGTTDDAVINMSRDDENEKPLTVNDTCKDGKSVIGGRKALENRRFIKHLTSEQESTGFKHDLKTAISRILGEKKSLEDKNIRKRNVIKHQTQDTKHSLAESILRAKSMIMNENVDKERDKRSFLCRQTIKQTLSNPVRPAVLSQRTFAREIAFAKEIILPGRAHSRAARRTKAKCDARSTNFLDNGAAAINSETRPRTKYMNHKDYQKWKKDAETKKAKGVKPDVSLPNMKQIASFYNVSIPDVDYDVTVCQCYYCDKHRKRDGAMSLLKLSRFNS